MGRRRTPWIVLPTVGRALGLAAALSSLAACGADAPAVPEKPPFTKGTSPRKAPPAYVVGGFSVDLPEVTLAPGEEQTPCYLLPLEIQGPSHLVGGGVMTAPPGVHHGNITTRLKTGEGVRPCEAAVGAEADDILSGGAVLFGSSTQITGEEWQSFPDGVAYRIKDGFEIVTRMHYLNVTAAPLTIAPRYEWFTIDEAKLVHEVGPFAWRFAGFEIPPRSELTVTGGCRFPDPMNIVNAMPHMHQLGRAFTVDFLGGPLDGERFLDSPGYDPDRGVIVQYDPPIDLGQGDGARFSCTWDNTHDKTIVEGIGDNEMCILFGYAWPPAQAVSAFATGPEVCVPLFPPAP